MPVMWSICGEFWERKSMFMWNNKREFPSVDCFICSVCAYVWICTILYSDHRDEEMWMWQRERMFVCVTFVCWLLVFMHGGPSLFFLCPFVLSLRFSVTINIILSLFIENELTELFTLLEYDSNEQNLRFFKDHWIVWNNCQKWVKKFFERVHLINNENME